MKNNLKIFIMFFLVASHIDLISTVCIYQPSKESGCRKGGSQNLWQPHSYSNAGTREILILQELNLKKQNGKGWINIFGAAPEYMQSFGKDNGKYGLGALPFWSGTNSMTIGTNDGLSDLDAYQFGLGQVVTQGKITLEPLVKQMGVTFYNYAMQSKNAPGVYIKAALTYGAMYINPQTFEDPAEKGSDALQVAFGYPAHPVQYKTLTDALYSGYSYQIPLYRFGKISRCRTKYLGAGDASLVVGYNGIVKENSHVGVGAKFLYPMGNWSEGQFMLEPIFGGCGHTGLGIDISAHYTYYLDEYRDTALSFWLQSEIQHLFPGRKPAFRSFDLAANGPGSKYLLLQQYLYDASTLKDSPVGLVPAINITTLPVLSSFPVEGNCTVMINYRINNIDFGVSTEVWGRSKEGLVLDLCEELTYAKEPGYNYNIHDYAVAGRQLNLGEIGPHWCEPLARINKSIDYIEPSLDPNPNPYPGLIKDAMIPANRLPKDYYQALDVEGARISRIVTGKFSGQVGYTMLQTKNTLRLALFGGVELSPKDSYTYNQWSFGFVFAMQY